jgi:hypothetical protein
MENKVFILFGATGEYSDAREWPVCASLSEEKVVSLCEKLTTIAASYGDPHDPDYFLEEVDREELTRLLKEAGDEYAYIWMGGVAYYVAEVSLLN